MPALHVDQSIEINASIEALKEELLDFRRWKDWSPWLCAEPDCKVDYASDGQSYRWDGAIIGAGSMTRLDVRDDGIDYDLTFEKPYKSTSKVDFHFVANGSERTTVHWRMHGAMPLFLFFMVKRIQASVAMDYQRGLAKLKDKVETGEVHSHLEFPGVGQGIDASYLGVRRVTGIEEIGAASTRGFERLSKALKAHDLTMTGPGMTISHSYDPVRDRLAYTLAVPIAKGLDGAFGSEFVSGHICIPKSYKVVHKGPYRYLANAWASGMMHERAKVFAANKRLDKVEVYISDPAQVAAQDLVTELHFPAR